MMRIRGLHSESAQPAHDAAHGVLKVPSPVGEVRSSEKDESRGNA